MIRDWRYTVKLELREPYGILELARAGFAACSFNCRYRLILEEPFVYVGLSYGQAGKVGVWKDPRPAYVHQMLVDRVPENDRDRLNAAIERIINLGTRDEQWNHFFPEISVSLGGMRATPTEIQPGDGPPAGWLRRRFELGSGAQDLVGEEVDFELTYQSLAPKSLTSFSVFYPWLTDGCTCHVHVHDDLDNFVCLTHFALGQPIHAKVEAPSKSGRGVTVSTEDVILPGASFELNWSRRSQRRQPSQSHAWDEGRGRGESE